MCTAGTEEPYELMAFGTAGKGSKGDAPFEHTTGRGWVKSKRGQYYDALHVKRCIENINKKENIQKERG